MQMFLYVIAAIFILGIIIMIHELGHYTAGRLLGFTILEFNIGMGPKAMGWRRKGIDYNLRYLPIGGSVRFLGEDENTDDPGAMNRQPAWKRLIVISAGAIMNIVLAIVLSILMAGFYGGTLTPRIDKVLEGTPAQAAGVLPGDVITSVNGHPVQTREDVSTGMALNTQTVTMTVQREGSGEHTFIIQPAMDEQSGTPMIGIHFTRIPLGFIETISQGTAMAFENVNVVLNFFKRLILFQIPQQELAESVGGPVAIGTALVTAVDRGFDWVLFIAAMISINLGVFNLLPLPALDGGRLVFILVEMVRGKPVPPEKEGMVHFVGLMLLFGLALLVTFKDIRSLFV